MWYSSGLQFQCKQCGRCCSGEPGYVWVTEDEITAIAAELGTPREQFVATFVREIKGRGKSLVEFDDGDCCLLGSESRKCQVYESRPTQCRTWPFWQRNVDSKNSWKKTAKFCPGCNQGPIFSAENIEESAKKTS
ncbi:MAG: YkgJ family cysteine cluster protein [Thermoguttaceae bacterium]